MTDAKIPPPKRGDTITAAYLGNVSGRLDALDGSRTVRTRQPQGSPPESDVKVVAVGGGAAAEEFTITGETLNTWTCTRVATGQTGVAVAKPWALRGAIAQRTDDGEDQVIGPFYQLGVTRILAVSFADAVLGTEWFDLNVDGRAWTMVYLGP